MIKFMLVSNIKREEPINPEDFFAFSKYIAYRYLKVIGLVQRSDDWNWICFYLTLKENVNSIHDFALVLKMI